MKKKFFWLLALVLICTSCLFACSPLKLNGGPNLADTVYGNGGPAVVKGDYLYFANAYKNYEELGINDNKYNEGDTKTYGIYRVKLNGSGAVDVNEEGTPLGAELLMPLICGYSKSSLYICGDYLFYTTPYSVNLSGQSSITTGYLRFERVKLDGTNREVLSEGEYTVDCDYNINYIDGTTYITIFGNKGAKNNNDENQDGKETKDIEVIWAKDGNHGRYEKITGTSSFATYLQEDIYYNRSIDNVNKYVYYTKNNNSEYSLYRKSLSNGNEEPLIINSDKEIKLVAVKNNRVYYKEDNILCSSVTFRASDKKVYTVDKIQDDATTGIVDYFILDDTIGSAPIDRGIVAVRSDDSSYSVIHYNGSYYDVKNSFALKHEDNKKKINIVFAKGGQVFYTIEEDEDKILYSYDLVLPDEKENHNIVMYNFSSSVDDTNVTFDYDCDRIFFFAKVDNSNQKFNYLQMALLEGNIYKNDEGKSIANYIGLLEQSDIKQEEEE